MNTEKKIKLILFTCTFLLLFSGCNNSSPVRNKVFQNGLIMIIFYDNQVSYNMFIYKDYKYDKKTKTVIIQQKNLFNEDVFEKLTYDPKNNCIYDEEGTRYDYLGKTKDIKFYNK